MIRRLTVIQHVTPYLLPSHPRLRRYTYNELSIGKTYSRICISLSSSQPCYCPVTMEITKHVQLRDLEALKLPSNCGFELILKSQKSQKSQTENLITDHMAELRMMA